MTLTLTRTYKASADFLRSNLPTVCIHLFIWLALFSLPLLFRPHGGGPGSEMRPLPFRIPTPIWTNNLFMILAFYCNLLIFMPNYFNKKKWGFYVLFTCLFLMASFTVPALSRWVDHLMGQNIQPFMNRGHRPQKGFEFRHFSFIYMFAMVWAISMTYSLFMKLQESLQHANKVHAAALQSELSFLKAQVNPHFLFNTLNNIYVLTLKKSDDAALAVMKLSNLMRKITDDTGVDYVPFEEEATFIKDYIELQELRLTEKTKVFFEITGAFESLSIAPRILIPFIDNAFKYGVSNRFDSEIRIRFEFIGKQLYFTLQNAIHPTGGESLESSGVGLDNAKRRLNLLYPDKHLLKITKTPESYHVLLKMDLA